MNNDYWNVSDRVLAKKLERGESWIESVAAGIAAVILFFLLVVVLAFLSV